MPSPTITSSYRSLLQMARQTWLHRSLPTSSSYQPRIKTLPWIDNGKPEPSSLLEGHNDIHQFPDPAWSAEPWWEKMRGSRTVRTFFGESWGQSGIAPSISCLLSLHILSAEASRARVFTDLCISKVRYNLLSHCVKPSVACHFHPSMSLPLGVVVTPSSSAYRH